MMSEMSLTALRVQGVDTVHSKLRLLTCGHLLAFVTPCLLLWPQIPEQSDWNAASKRECHMKAILGISNYGLDDLV